MELAHWAARHIESVQISAQTPVFPGAREGLEEWDLQVVRGKLLVALRSKLSTVESKTCDGRWLTQRIGLVIIKD